MYHELTLQQKKAKRTTQLMAVAVAVLLVIAVALAMALGNRQAREQSAISIRQAILDASMQCAAVEGSFPSSLDYLEKHYGLRINHKDFRVNYEVYAANVIPSVVVVPR